MNLELLDLDLKVIPTVASVNFCAGKDLNRDKVSTTIDFSNYNMERVNIIITRDGTKTYIFISGSLQQAPKEHMTSLKLYFQVLNVHKMIVDVFDNLDREVCIAVRVINVLI